MADHAWLAFSSVGPSEWSLSSGLMVIRNLLTATDEAGDIVSRHHSLIHFSSFLPPNVCTTLDAIRTFKSNTSIGVFRCLLNIVIVRDL